jgi:hypothetical protein
MILVITEEPETAAAACLARVPERLTARRMASATASTSTMFFSTTALGGKRLDGVVLDAVAAAAFRELEQLYGGGTDVQADQRRFGISEKTHGFSPCHGRLHAIRAPLH